MVQNPIKHLLNLGVRDESTKVRYVCMGRWGAPSNVVESQMTYILLAFSVASSRYYSHCNKRFNLKFMCTAYYYLQPPSNGRIAPARQ